MKNKNLILSLAILSVVILGACQKTDNGPALTPQQKALINKNWKLKSLTVAKLSDPTQDSSITKSCSDSALMAFNVYGQYQLADVSKGCDTTIVPYSVGTWALSSDSDSLLLSNSKRSMIWKIEMLNDTIIKATFRDSISPVNNRLKKIILK